MRTKSFEISAPIKNEEFKFSNGSYSTSDIQDYFEYTFKNMEYLKIYV